MLRAVSSLLVLLLGSLGGLCFLEKTLKADRSLQEYHIRFDDDDLNYVGTIDQSGLFTPNVEGPNTTRRQSPVQIRLRETEPGLYYGVYRTTEPIFKKSMFGVGRLDLRSRQLETFEIGPALRLGLFKLSPDKTRGYAVARNTGASGELNDLVVLDIENHRLLARKEGFDQGRPNGSLIVSGDGKKLYSSGAGDTIHIYDSSTLNLIQSVFAGGDVMLPARALPRSVLAGTDQF